MRPALNDRAAATSHVGVATDESQRRKAAQPRRGPRLLRAWARASRSDRILAILLALCVLGLIAIRLGASLVGARVFLGLDLLNLFAPWSASAAEESSGTSIYVSDQIDWYVPAMHEIAERFRQGDFAAWTSLVGGGVPLLATPDFALFSPGRWLYVVLPLALAPGWSKLLEMCFAAAFTYLFGRRLGASRVAAGVAGFIYPLTGFMIGWTNWPQTAVGSVIPMLFWAIERFLQKPRVLAATPISLAAALLVLGGFPAVAGHTFLVVAGYAVVRSVSLYRQRLLVTGRALLVAGGAVVLGVGLAAFQLVPFAFGILGGTDLSYRQSGFFSSVPQHYLLTSVFPLSFTGNDVLKSFGSPMDLNSYVGSVVLLLATLGLLAGFWGVVQRSVVLYLAAVVVFCVVVIWFQGPWVNWLDQLPVFHGNPIGRIRAQLGIPAAVLAGAGVDLLRGHTWARPANRRLARQAVIIAVATTAGVWAAGFAFANAGGSLLPQLDRGDVLLAGLPLIVVSCLLALGLRVRAARVAAIGVAILAISVQANVATGFYWPTADRSSFYASSDGLRYLQQNIDHDRIAGSGFAVRPNINQIYGLRSITAHTFYPKRMQALLEEIYPNVFNGPTYAQLLTVPDLWLSDPGLDRLGVRFLIGDDNAPYPGTTNMPVPIPGDLDPLTPSVGERSLSSGRTYAHAIASGPLRGVSIPLTLRADTVVAVELKDQEGRLIAHNSVRFGPGTWDIPVPLAAESPDTNQIVGRESQLTVEVTANSDGVRGSFDAAGDLRMQAVRSPQDSDNARLAYAGDDLVIWERLGALPRIRWADDVTVISDDELRLQAVARAAVDHDGVILAAAPEQPVSEGDASPSRFDVVQDSGDEIVVDVTTPEAGYVVVADSLGSDFEATVDGGGTEIVEADYAFGAVYVPAGTHQVHFRNSPKGGTLGSAVSAGSAVALTCVWLVPMAWSSSRRRLQSGAEAKGGQPAAGE